MKIWGNSDYKPLQKLILLYCENHESKLIKISDMSKDIGISIKSIGKYLDGISNIFRVNDDTIMSATSHLSCETYATGNTDIVSHVSKPKCGDISEKCKTLAIAQDKQGSKVSNVLQLNDHFRQEKSDSLYIYIYYIYILINKHNVNISCACKKRANKSANTKTGAKNMLTEKETGDKVSSGIENEELWYQWWSKYPVKQGRQVAMKSWGKCKADKRVLIDALIGQIKRREEIAENGGWLPRWPNPATWINASRWEDDLDALGVVSDNQSSEKPQDISWVME